MKRMLIVCLLLLLLPALAQATEVTPLPANRLLISTDAVSPDPVISNGTLTIAIDDDATDWNKLFLNSLGSMASVPYEVVPPQNAEWWMKFTTGSSIDEAAVLATFTEQEQAPGEYTYFRPLTGEFAGLEKPGNSISVAEYIEDEHMLLPLSTDDSDEPRFYIRWYDGNKNVIETNCLAIKVSHSRQDAFSFVLTLPKTAASRITPAVNSKASVQDGQVAYIVTAEDTSVRLKTLVSPPSSGNAQAVKCERMVNGNSVGTYQQEKGMFALDLPMQYMNQLFTLRFTYDDNSTQTEQLRIIVEGESNEPWVTYFDDNWGAIPNANVLITNNAEALGFRAVYADGIYTESMTDPSGLPVVGARNHLAITLRAPEGAAYVARGNGRANGKHHGYAGRPLEDIRATAQEMWDSAERYDALYTVDGSGFVQIADGTAFREIRPEGTDLTLYLPLGDQSPYAELFYWYDANGNLLAQNGRQYLCWEYGDFESVSTGIIAQNKESLGVVKVPTAIGQQNWRLMLTRYGYANTDGNVRFYDLHLQDMDGNIVHPLNFVGIYLPYPNGWTYETAKNIRWKLLHYTNGLYDERNNGGSNVDITPTEQGLYFEVDSFSPFVLSWEEPTTPVIPTTPNVPKTGDSTPIVLWLVLMAISAVGAALMRRKAKA